MEGYPEAVSDVEIRPPCRASRCCRHTCCRNRWVAALVVCAHMHTVHLEPDAALPCHGSGLFQLTTCRNYIFTKDRYCCLITYGSQYLARDEFVVFVMIVMITHNRSDIAITPYILAFWRWLILDWAGMPTVLTEVFWGFRDTSRDSNSVRPRPIPYKNALFWDVTPCGSCNNRRFRGTYRLRHQGEKNQRARNSVSGNYQLKHIVTSYF
jgi:hypothetical protein